LLPEGVDHVDGDVGDAMCVPEGAVGPGPPVVVVDRASSLVAVRVDRDAAHELLNDRVLLGCARAVDATGQAVEQLFQVATLNCLIVEPLRPVVEAGDVLFDFR